MENIINSCTNIIQSSFSRNLLFKRNLLKDYLQILVLDFIYSHPVYSRLVFYGGSCLVHCHQMTRLSEDLDFVDVEGKVSLTALKKDLLNFFKKNHGISPSASIQKFRIYLKFPILHELELAKSSESGLLFLKLEVFSDFGFCQNYNLENIPLFKYNKSILVKAFDLSTLMSTKIRAIFFRKWEKTGKNGRVSIKVKGRDYFDLMWYLQKNIKPNYECLDNINNKSLLRNKLTAIIDKVDSRSIELDLESLIDQPGFVKNMSRKMKEILINEISSKL